MGKANRERRRMKEKARKAKGPTQPAHGLADDWPGWLGAVFDEAPPPPAPRERIEALVEAALHALDHRDDATAARTVAKLAAKAEPGWQHQVELVVDQALAGRVGTLWRAGWQPVDLVRLGTRRLAPAQHRLLRAAIATELSGYAPATVDARWSAQLAETEAEVWWDRRQVAVQACAVGHPEGWAGFLRLALELLHLLARLPALQVLGPIPGEATRMPVPARSAVDERVLDRVRALLAKAESTTFPAEAETFTAGAQALMARHSIDHALLAATGRAPRETPAGRRIGIDNPYEAPKAILLDALASANHCRAIWSKELGFATVVGFPNDLDTVEVLFTSLLVQAVATLTREGSRADWVGRSRTRAFRQSFLLSYATRIRERLTETTRQQTEAAAAEPSGSNLLPILATRQAEVEEATSAMFPRLTFSSMTSARDGEGWASGRAAADLATLQATTGAIG